MVGEIATIDTASMAEAIRGKIRMEVVNLIPEAAWTSMIEAEIRAFTQPPKIDHSHSYQPRDERSPCAKIIHEIIGERLKAIAMVRLDDFLKTHWDAQKQEQTLSEVIGKIAEESASSILAKLMEGFVAHTIQSMRNSGQF